MTGVSRLRPYTTSRPAPSRNRMAPISCTTPRKGSRGCHPRRRDAVNQVEAHPFFQQREVQDFNRERGILTQAWSPIGGITHYRDGQHRSALQDPVINAIGDTHGKSAAQVMLRWGLQQGRSVIPKSTQPERIAENVDVDLELSDDEIAAIDALETGIGGGPEPEAVTLENFGRPIPEA